MRRAFLLVFGLLASSVSAGNAKIDSLDLVPPSSDALALVRVMEFKPASKVDADYLGRMARYVVLMKASKPSCDSNDLRCSSAAEEVGLKLMKDRMAFDQKIVEYVLAAYIEKYLTAGQIAEAVRKSSDPATRDLVNSVVNRPSGVETFSLMRRVEQEGIFGKWDDAPYLKEFEDRTKDLPRANSAQMTIPLPSPLPPSPLGGQ